MRCPRRAVDHNPLIYWSTNSPDTFGRGVIVLDQREQVAADVSWMVRSWIAGTLAEAHTDSVAASIVPRGSSARFSGGTRFRDPPNMGRPVGPVMEGRHDWELRTAYSGKRFTF